MKKVIQIGELIKDNKEKKMKMKNQMKTDIVSIIAKNQNSVTL